VPPHVASGDTFRVGVEEGGGATRVDEGRTVTEDVLDVVPLPVQVPNAELQLAPQWSLELPHHPYCEQQLPNEEPWQVKPFDPPQLPSVETALLSSGAAGEAEANPTDSRPAVRETRNFIVTLEMRMRVPCQGSRERSLCKGKHRIKWHLITDPQVCFPKERTKSKSQGR
jgi:hypothetical protein